MPQIRGINIPKESNVKNYIINGNMDQAQRGTSFAAIVDNTYSLDRWHYSKSSEVVHTITQDIDVPTLAQANYLFKNSLRANVTTADASIAAGQFVLINQKIEGYNWKNLAQKAFTVSFWVKSTVTGIHCIAMRNSGSDRSYVAEYTINATNTWEYKTITVAASPSAGTWDYTNGVGLQLFWTLASGSTFQTTAGSWQTGTFFSTSNQVNNVGTIGNDFRITGVMVNEGYVAAPFVLFGEDQEGELSACQRYYETGKAGNGGYADNTSLLVSGATWYKVTKRAVAIITAANISNSSWSQAGILDSPLTFNAQLFSAISGFAIRTNNPNSRAAGSAGIMSYDWFVDTEL